VAGPLWAECRSWQAAGRAVLGGRGADRADRMIGSGQRRRRLPAITRALLSVAIAVALWLFRPGPPSLPPSFSAPLTTETIEGLTVWLLWLVGVLLALAVLLTPRQARTRMSIAAVPRSRRTSRLSPRRARSPQSQPPTLIV